MSAQYQEMRRTAEAPGTIKLYYFDAAGRCEPVRANFAVGGVKYEDVRIPFQEWPNFKPKTPFGGMPVLEIDGKMVAQSSTCARLSAKLAGLSGKSLFEEALVDSVTDTVTEIREKCIPFMNEKDEEKKKAGIADITANFLPGKLAALERFIGDHNGGKDGFFCGGELTWADLSYVVNMEFLAPVIPNCDEDYPKLKALTASVNADPRVKTYIANKPAKK